MAEIDLEMPGTLVCSALHAKEYQFLIVASKPEFTPAAFEKDPKTAKGADLLFEGPMLPDKGNAATLDLAPKAKEIRDRLKATRTPVKIVLLGTMKNYPGKRRAVIEDHVLVRGDPKIKLEPEKKSLDVGKQMNVKVTCQDLDAASVGVEPTGKFMTVNKPTIEAKSDNLIVKAVSHGKATLVVQGLVSGQVRVIEKLEIECVGPQVKFVDKGLGYVGESEAKAEAQAPEQAAPAAPVKPAEPPKDPKIAIDPAKVDPGAEVQLTLEGPVSEDYTIFFTPQADAAKAGAVPVNKRTPVGKLDAGGKAKGKLKLDEAEFKPGKYDVVLMTMAGKDSPKAALEVNKVRGPLVADGYGNRVICVDPKTGATTVVTPLGCYPVGIVLDQKLRMFVATSGGTVALVDEKTGQHRDIAKGFANVTRLANDPETNDLYLVAQDSGSVIRINPDTGASETVASGLASPCAVAVAGDFVFITTPGKLWAMQRKTKRLHEVMDVPGADWGITFDATGLYCYLCGYRTGKVLKANLKDCKVEREWSGFGQPYDILLTDANTLVAFDGEGGQVKSLDLASGKITTAQSQFKNARQVAPSDKPYPPYKSQFKPAIADLYGGSYRGEVYEMNRKTAKKKVLANGLPQGCGVAVDTKGRVFMVCPWNGVFLSVDPATGAKRIIHNLGADTFYIAADPENDDLYVTNHSAGSLRRVNAETGAATHVASGLPGAMGVAMAGDYLFVGSHGVGNLYLVHKRTGATEVFLQLPAAPSRIAMGKDDELWAVGNPDQGSIFRISISGRKVLRQYPQPGGTYGCVWEEDSGKVLLANNFHLTRLDPETGQTTRFSSEAGDHDGLTIGLPKKRRSPK